jgi:predicted amidohydrolase YtcJ
LSGSTYLIRNGSIYTVNPTQPWAQAVVVRDDTITYVGTEHGAQNHTDSETIEIDLHG